MVDADELIKYVSDQVPIATANKQHPREFGTYDNMMRLSDTRKPGITIAQSLDVAHWRVILDSRHGGPLYLAGAPQAPLPGATIAGHRSIASRPPSARDAFCPPIRTTLSRRCGISRPLATPEQYQERENQLRVALENKAQEVLLRYLAGDETPQSREEFQSGARYMEAARTLTQESLFLEGREDFFQGRALLFDKKFPEAANLLEQAVRIDPGGAYGFNALGIAYLEQAQYDKAIPAFRDAVRRAQHWSYPLHNEALAYVETGDYQSAIRAYQEAIRLTPQYSYLPYNLGLVYQRLNRRKDAETAYTKAEMLAPNSAEPYNALGTLKASEGKRAEAEQLYRQALQKNPSSAARAAQSGAVAGGPEEPRDRKRSICGARICDNRRIICRRVSAWLERWPRRATTRGLSRNTARFWKPNPITRRPASRWRMCWLKTNDREARSSNCGR